MDQLTFVIDTLDRISTTSSTTEKKKILRETKCDLLGRIFKLTYDPFANYGVVKIDLSDVQFGLNTFNFDKLFDTLDKLQKREITGNAARVALKKCMTGCPEPSGELVTRIIKGDLRLGAGKRLISDSYQKLFPENSCMLAGKYDSKYAKFPVYVDTKLDGVRCVAVRKNRIQLFSRGDRPFTNYKTVEDEIAQLDLPPEICLDGEIMSGHFQDLMRTIHRKNGGIELAKDSIYNIFDLQLPGMSHSIRLPILKALDEEIKAKGLTHLSVNLGKTIYSEEELMEYYQSVISQGFEGIMIKDPSANYEFGRSRSWMKMKPEETEDLEIVKVVNGTGKYSDVLGALVCKLPNGNTVHVGTGYSDEDRTAFWNDRSKIIGLVAEIKFQEKTKDGSLRFPVFIRFRPDKMKV